MAKTPDALLEFRLPAVVTGSCGRGLFASLHPGLPVPQGLESPMWTHTTSPVTCVGPDPHR